MRGFKSSEAARLAGVSLRQLDHWDRVGLVSPSLAEAAGRGSARFYSFRDLVLLAAAARLRELGLGLSALRRAVEELAALPELEAPVPETYLVVRPGSARLLGGVRELARALSGPEAAAVLDLAALARQLSARAGVHNQKRREG